MPRQRTHGYEHLGSMLTDRSVLPCNSTITDSFEFQAGRHTETLRRQVDMLGWIAVIAVGIAFGAAVLWAGWWLWWQLPKLQVTRFRLSDEKARADVEDNFRKTISQLLGGAAVLLGTGVAYYQTQRSLQASDEESRRSLQASHDLLISQQVSKGFEQLGSEKPLLQIGGIYALEGVMNSSQPYSKPVLEAICAFVRNATKDNMDNGSPSSQVQAALTVVGRRKVWSQQLDVDASVAQMWLAIRYNEIEPGELGEGRVNLLSSHIPNANLFVANLMSADLKNADLRGADLRMAHLRYAQLNNAHLNGADLREADLGNADLTNADLSDANLTEAKISQSELNNACGTGIKGLSGQITLNKPCMHKS